MLFSGCAGTESLQQWKQGGVIVLTNGFSDNEVFKIEGAICTLPEVMLLLKDMENRYDRTYGEHIWNVEHSGETVFDNLKDQSLSRMAQIKTMGLLAGRYGIGLSTEEMEMVEKTADNYSKTLNAEVAEKYGIDAVTVLNLYREYAIANKVYQYIIKDINPEISDDEARTVTVERILISAEAADESGRVYTGSRTDEEARLLAEEIRSKAISEEEPFEVLMLEYSDADEGTISFGQGEMEPEFEDAAFRLATGEISGAIRTSQGYEIIKCITTFDKTQTDANKDKIVNDRRHQTFSEEYEAFVSTLTRKLNSRLWNSVDTDNDSEPLAGLDFMDNYDVLFAEYEWNGEGE